jgi:hypothetical protein
MSFVEHEIKINVIVAVPLPLVSPMRMLMGIAKLVEPFTPFSMT